MGDESKFGRPTVGFKVSNGRSIGDDLGVICSGLRVGEFMPVESFALIQSKFRYISFFSYLILSLLL